MEDQSLNLNRSKRKSGRNTSVAIKIVTQNSVGDITTKSSLQTAVEPVDGAAVKGPNKSLRISEAVLNPSPSQTNDLGDGSSEICILPDDNNVGSRLRRSREERRRSHRDTKASPASPAPIENTGRPKRNAARAAGSKIKSLVNNSLEAVCLEEVDQPITQQCAQCKRMKLCRFVALDSVLCSEDCHSQWTRRALDAPFVRTCSQCRGEIRDGSLAWETMEFCTEECLGKYQATLGSFCSNCKKTVLPASMGKFCVRFGHDIKQFCTPSCLEEHKKGLKVCSYCQKDISSGVEGFLAPVGNKGQFKDFCSQSCMTKYEQMNGSAPIPQDVSQCAVCSHRKTVKVEVLVGTKINKLCSEPCFAAFKFVNNVAEGRCEQCKKYFDKAQSGRIAFYFEERPIHFCGKTCMNGFILGSRKIVPCGSCKVKKYNFDMIKKTVPQGVIMACSLTCLTACQQSGSKPRRFLCEFCLNTSTSQYKISLPDGTVKNCCSYGCAVAYKKRLGKGKTTGADAVNPTVGKNEVSSPYASGVESIASPATPVQLAETLVPPPPKVYQHIVTRPPEPKQSRNKAVLCKPYTHNKGTSCRPMPCYKSTQTDESLTRKCLIPVPVPIYIPAPMQMFSAPFPVPTPFPLPVPVPIFIPTTRNSAKGIFKEIKKIQEKIPTDPFEAELLMMAEMVAGEKKQDPTDSESEDGPDAEVTGGESFSPEAVDTSNTFGDDIMQMALKMASELEEPAVDMESVLTSNTITPSAQPTVDSKALYAPDPDEAAHALAIARGRKRPMRGGRGATVTSKRGRRSAGEGVPAMAPPEPVTPARLEVEKPDANMCLKYTFGVNAWRHWVMQKNAELEKAAMTNRKIKPFKPDLLQLTADELNFSLCLFVKEVKKPNGQDYAPDTIHYLCLGIQQYLFENGRIDNIFTDAYYEKFTDCLDEVAKRFAALYNDSQFIVTRVEEEHLWESKQLGAHSPHVLLNTLMFFNTKHFNLVSVEEHMQLSFSHIMKHWKRNPNAPGVAKVPGSRNVLLRFYPPQSALEANSRKKKVYEQQENEENPLRCPVKLYEFYLSKCPESVKTRNDVFYLLPERSCVPDSPVWYSTMALGREPLMKMLHRIKMVKEINVAVLSS